MLTACIYTVTKEKKGTKCKIVSIPKKLPFQKQQDTIDLEGKYFPSLISDRHTEGAERPLVFTAPGERGGGMKEEPKHFSQGMGSMNPSCNFRNHKFSLWKRITRGQPYSHLMVQHRGSCPASSHKTRSSGLSAENSSHPC